MMNSMMSNMFGHPDPFGFNQMSHQMLSPFGAFDMFPRHQSMMSMINSNMNNPNSTYYCSSSVMSMSTDYTGRSHVYEQTSSTRGGPGGLRETRNTTRDTRSGLHQMSIGHHIHDRGHVVSKSRNHYTGEEEHNEEYLNLDESEGQQFENDWQRRVTQSFSNQRYNRSLPQFQSRGGRNPQQVQQLALPAPPEKEEKKRSKLFHKKQKDKKGKPYSKN